MPLGASKLSVSMNDKGISNVGQTNVDLASILEKVAFALADGAELFQLLQILLAADRLMGVGHV